MDVDQYVDDVMRAFNQVRTLRITLECGHFKLLPDSSHISIGAITGCRFCDDTPGRLVVQVERTRDTYSDTYDPKNRAKAKPHPGEVELRQLMETQGVDGTWNYSPYMRGLYNGLVLAVATIEGRDPGYRDEPESYLCDRPAPDLSGPEFAPAPSENGPTFRVEQRTFRMEWEDAPCREHIRKDMRRALMCAIADNGLLPTAQPTETLIYYARDPFHDRPVPAAAVEQGAEWSTVSVTLTSPTT